MNEVFDDTSRRALTEYRLNKAKITLNEVNILLESELYNTAVNRIYYACYYATIALLVSKNIQANTHAGVKQMLGLHFISTNRISAELGRFYTQLFNDRMSGDYDDFVTFNKQMIEEVLPKAIKYISEVEKLLNEELFQI